MPAPFRPASRVPGGPADRRRVRSARPSAATMWRSIPAARSYSISGSRITQASACVRTAGPRAPRRRPGAGAGWRTVALDHSTSLEPKLQLASIQKTLPATLPTDHSRLFGYQDPTAWASFGTWMFTHQLLRNDPNAGLPPFTNEFLPGEGI
jgi:hypothetical protein